MRGRCWRYRRLIEKAKIFFYEGADQCVVDPLRRGTNSSEQPVAQYSGTGRPVHLYIVRRFAAVASRPQRYSQDKTPLADKASVGPRDLGESHVAHSGAQIALRRVVLPRRNRHRAVAERV